MSSRMFQNGSPAPEEVSVPNERDEGGHTSAPETTTEFRPRSVRKRAVVERYDPWSMTLATYHNRGEKIATLTKCEDVIEVDIESDTDDFRPKKQTRSQKMPRSRSTNSSNRQKQGSAKPKQLLSSADKCNAVDKKYHRPAARTFNPESSGSSTERDIQRSFSKASSSVLEGLIMLGENSSDGSSASSDRRIVQPRKAKQGRTYDEELLQAGFLPGLISDNNTGGGPSVPTGLPIKEEKVTNGEPEREQDSMDSASAELKKLPNSMIKQMNIFKQKYKISASKPLNARYKALSVKRARNKGVSTSLVDTEQKRLQTGYSPSIADSSVRIRKQVSPYQYPERPRAFQRRDRRGNRIAKQVNNSGNDSSVESDETKCITGKQQKSEQQEQMKNPSGGDRMKDDGSELKTENELNQDSIKIEAEQSSSPRVQNNYNLSHRISRLLRKKVSYSREHQERLFKEGKFVIEGVNFEMLDVCPVWRIVTKDKMLRKYEPVIIDGRLCHMAVDAFKVTRFRTGEFETLFQPVVFDLLVDTSEFSVGVAHVLEESAHLYGYFDDTEQLLSSYEHFLEGIIAQALCGKNPFFNNARKGLENINQKLEELAQRMESFDFWPEKVKDLIVRKPFLRAAIQNQTQPSELVPCPCCLHKNRTRTIFVRCYFRGQNYNRQSFAPLEDSQEENMEKCCRSCLHRILAFHRLYHYKYWLFLCVRDAIQSTRELLKDNQVLDARDVFKFLISDFKWMQHMFYDFQSVMAACEEEMRIYFAETTRRVKRIATGVVELKLNPETVVKSSSSQKQKISNNQCITQNPTIVEKPNLEKASNTLHTNTPIQFSSEYYKLTPVTRVYSVKHPNSAALPHEMKFKKAETQISNNVSLNRASERDEQMCNLFDRLNEARNSGNPNTKL